MPDAELEISIQRRARGFTADARFTSPDHDVQPAAEVPLALDLTTLRELHDDPTAYGRLFSAQLFADARLRSAWQQARAVAQQRGTLRLRLRLTASDADLHSLRWELLRDPEDDTPLALNERVRLSRYLESADFTPLALPLRPDLRALVVVANPSDLGDYGLAEVDVGGEVARARAALADIPTTILGDHADAHDRATLPAISAALRDGPHILLLICHGTLAEGATTLWLEGEDGASVRVTGADFVQAVTQLNTRPLLIVLAACQSAGGGYGDALAALGPRLAQQGIPAVLAFQGAIGMTTVERLLPPLFTELRRDGSIDRALAAARGAIRQQADWWQAVLWLRVRDGQLWQREPTGPLRDVATDVRGLPNPYLGLKPFAYDDRGRFAGREDVVVTAVAWLATPGTQQTVLFITGASGSGKSSLAKAGIVPALEAAYGARHIPTQRAVMRPGTHPLAALGAALDGLAWPLGGAFAVADPFRFTTPLPSEGTPPIGLLVLDQAEELFNPQVESAQRDALIALLSSLPSFADLRMHIVVTMRADFLPNLFAYPPLYQIAKGGIDLYAMSVAQLQEAIARPVQVQYPAKRLEPALITRLAEDAAHDAALLPLLQVTLEDIWRRGRLTLASYGDLTDALRERADAVMDFTDYDGGQQTARPEADRAAILAIFLDLVAVSLDDNATRDVRRRQHLSNLLGDRVEAGQRQPLIDELSQARLLAADGEMQDGREVTVVDIIHESLITRWPRLRDAITAQRDQLQERERFSLALAEWQQEGQADAYLLSGVRLAEAEALRERGDIVLAQLGADVFATRSTRRRDDERRRQLQRTRAVAAILGILALLAIVAGGFAFERQLATEMQLRIANSQRLAFAAQSLSDEREELALQLAYEAYALDQNSITELVLHERVNQRQWHITPLQGHRAEVRSAIFSLDGSRILTASQDGTARLWDAAGQPLAILQGHSDWVYGAVFSLDGSRILTASQDGTARLWDATGQPLAILQGHSDWVYSAVFSPDRSRILTASWDGTARLWDVAGTFLATLQGHSAEVTSAVFSPDGSRILTASQDGTARLWDAAGQSLAILQGHSALVYSAVFSPDGSHILTASKDGTARLWDATGQPLAIFQGHSAAVTRAVFSPNGSRILTASPDGTARLWDAAGQPFATLQGHSAAVTRAVFSPDGSRILTASQDGTARLWNAAGQPLTTLQNHRDWVTSAVFSPDGSRILTASNDHTARLWDVAGQPLATLQNHTQGVTSAVFSPDGSRILTTSDDNTARLWDVAGTSLATLQGHRASVRSAVFSPDGSHILTASEDGTARLWTTAGRALATLQRHSASVYSAVFSPDGSHILTASDDNTARLWTTTGRALTTLSGHSLAVGSAVFSPDGSRILTASEDGTARLWTTAGRALVTLSGHNLAVYSAVFSPDGSRILTASEDGTARLWNTAGAPLATLQGHSDWVNSAMFSLDGSRILTTSQDNTARLWDTSGRPLATLSGHTQGVTSAVFSPDGSRILTTSQDNTARLWDAAGRPLATLAGHSDWVNSVVFSPDGSRLLTASEDGTARQYFVNPADLLAVAACRIGRALTDEEIALYNVPQPLHLDLATRRCPTLKAAQSATL